MYTFTIIKPCFSQRGLIHFFFTLFILHNVPFIYIMYFISIAQCTLYLHTVLYFYCIKYLYIHKMHFISIAKLMYLILSSFQEELKMMCRTCQQWPLYRVSRICLVYPVENWVISLSNLLLFLVWQYWTILVVR